MEKNVRPKIPKALNSYDRVDPLSNGYFRVWQNGKCGIECATYYRPTLKPEWDKIKFKHGYFYVWKDGKRGVYNKHGYRVLYPMWDRIQYIKPYFFVWRDANCSIFSKNGVLIAEHKWDKVEYVKPYFRVWRNNKCGLINRHFPTLFELKVEWDKIRIAKNNHFLVCRDNKYGVRSDYRTIVLKNEWDSITPVYGKHGAIIYIAQKNGKYGIRNSNGKAILKTEADRIEVKDDCFFVTKNRTWAFFKPFESFYLGLSFSDIQALPSSLN